MAVCTYTPGCDVQAERIAAYEARLDVERQDKEVTESARAAAIKVLFCLLQPLSCSFCPRTSWACMLYVINKLSWPSQVGPYYMSIDLVFCTDRILRSIKIDRQATMRWLSGESSLYRAYYNACREERFSPLSLRAFSRWLEFHLEVKFGLPHAKRTDRNGSFFPAVKLKWLYAIHSECT